MNPTSINELQEKIANDAYLLYEALANLAHDNTETIANAIEAINDYVKEIGNAAQKAQLTGLSAICQQTGQNITTLSALDYEQIQTFAIEIENWPKLVSNYLYSPLNSKVHDQLIHFLQNNKWAKPMEDELANQLRDYLKADFINEPEAIIELPEYQETGINSEIIESTMPEKNEADEIFELADFIDESDEIIESPEYQETDINSDLVVESITLENSQTDEIIDSPVPKETNLNSELEGTIPENTEADKIIESQASQETTRINQSEEAESVIQEKTETSKSDTQTVHVDSSEVTEDTSNDSGTISDELLPTSPLYKKIIDMNDNLSVALTQLITSDAENEAFFEGLNQYTDTIQVFWELAESLGLKGFQDVCTFISDNVFECSSLSKSEKRKLHKPLKLWTKISLEYLEKPETKAPNLVKLLCLNSWPIPLSTEKSEPLLTQLVQDCSTPIITENHTKQQPKATPKPNVNDTVENDSLKSEPVSVEVEIVSNKSSDSEQFSDDDDEISDDTPEVFEPFYQENEFEPFELDTFNLTNPDSESSFNSSEVSEVEEAWITSHLEKTWIENDFGTDWELEEEEERVSTLSQQLTDDELSDSIQNQEKYGLDEESSVTQLENPDNFSNEIDISIRDVERLSELTPETEPLESLDSVTTHNTQEFPIHTDESKFVSKEVANEDKDSPTKVEKLPLADSEFDSEFDEEVPITDSELEFNEELPQKTTELTNDEALSAEEDHLLADDFELPIDEAELSAQEPDLSTDSLVEPEEELLEVSEEVWTDATTVQKEELSSQEPDVLTTVEEKFPTVPKPDLSTEADDNDEFSEQPSDLLTDNSIEHSDLPSEEDEEFPTVPKPDLSTEANDSDEFSEQPPDLLTDNSIEHSDLPSEKDEEYPTVPKLDLSTEADDSDEFSEPPPDLLTDDYIDHSDLPNQEDKEKSVLETDSVFDNFSNDSVSKDAEQITPVSDVSLEKEGLATQKCDLPNDDEEELSDSLATLNEDNLFSEDIDERQLLTDEVSEISDEQAISETSQVTEDSSVEGPNLSVTEDTLSKTSQITDNSSVEGPNLSIAEDTLSEIPQVTRDLSVEEPNLDNQSFSIETTNEAESQSSNDEVESQSSNEIILCSQEVLELLIGQIRDIAEDNASLLTDLFEAESESEQVLTATMTYTENVQAIWDAAEMANLTGLQDLCTFVNENVMALGSQSQSKRKAVRDVLLAWHENVIAYLQNPVSNVDRLVSGLQNEHWLTPLDNEAALALTQSLLTPATTEIEQAVVDENLPTSEKTKAHPNDVILTPPDDVDSELWEAYLQEMPRIAEAFSERIQKIIQEPDIEEIKSVQRFAHSMKASSRIVGVKGIANIAHHLENTLESLVEHQLVPPEALTNMMVDASDCLSIMVDALLGVGEPPSNALDILQSVLDWNNKIDKGELDAPQQSRSSTEIILAPPEVLELLIAQISDISENNAELINELVGAEEGSEAIFTAITTYTDNVQAVWDAADMASLNGLLEVCTFLNDNVMALGGLPQADRESVRSVLLAWPELMIAYLQNPGTHAKALVNLMQDNRWPSAMEEAETENLLISLTTTTNDSGIETSISDSTEASSETLVLATPDIVELVCNQIIDSQEGLSSALEVCISMENDNPAFLEAIEEYSSKVQEIVDVAEMAGLIGLIEVCTFINTNFVEFSIQEKTQRVEAQQYFLAWPAKVLDYLHSPNTGASELISFMQESSWPTPLSEEAAIELLTLLTQPAQTDEASSAVSEETEATSSESDESDDDDEQELTPLAVSIPDEIKLCKPQDLEVLVGGIEFGKEDLVQALNELVTVPQQEAAFAEAQESYTEPLENWSMAAEMVGLEALQTIFGFVTSNVNELQKIPPESVKKAKKVLEKWPNLLLDYLQAPTDNVVKLVNHFRLARWVQPLTDEAAQALLTQLVSGAKEVAPAPGEMQVRETEAHPEDVLLTPQDDVDPELWDAYLQELPQNAESFSESIQKIIQEPDLEEIKSAQRVAHTMKGSSRIVGVKGIANIAHHLEDTLEYLAEHQLAPPEALTNMMVDAADCLSIMVDALSGNDEPPANALDILQSVIDWANQIDKGELDAPPVPKKPKAESVQPATEVAPDKQPKTDNKKKADKQTTPEQMLQVPTKTIDELMRLVGELSISLGQIQEKLKNVTQNTRLLTERDLILQHKTFELENLVDVRGITGVENRYNTTATTDEEDFDPLEFEEYNELHSVAHSFTESIADNRELAISIREELSELETMFIHQERLNKDFQNSIMTTRMKQVKTIIPQLERNVRQTANKVKKKAKLEVTGADILVDSDVLNNLIAPLRHVLNNAVDHGLEPTEERTLVGKSEAGTISLSFYHEGNNVVIKCQDDGQGLNYTNIRFKAIEKELITEHQELTEQELARLILTSGFSTKPRVTQVSGRGVGMDVVHTTIRQMKGTLDLTSETGKGTTFLIKLPMTLVTVHVLVVRVGDRLFGIPTNNLEQALAPGVGEFHTVGEETTLKIGKNLYAIKYLADMLHIKGDWKALGELEKRPIVLVHEETGITAILVDEFLDTHDLVMKSMGKYVKNIHGVTGASILGDGSLVPLLDVPELLRSPMQAAISAYVAKHSVEDDDALASTPNIMIVDDSLSVRKSLSLLIENAGFEPLLAKDGIEAIEVMNETRPNVMLVDMEMPRMDGLELTAHVRANQATQNLPIFMITSRTTEKHRQQAKSAGVSAYLTKPYQDTELLDLIDKALNRQI